MAAHPPLILAALGNSQQQVQILDGQLLAIQINAALNPGLNMFALHHAQLHVTILGRLLENLRLAGQPMSLMTVEQVQLEVFWIDFYLQQLGGALLPWVVLVFQRITMGTAVDTLETFQRLREQFQLNVQTTTMTAVLPFAPMLPLLAAVSVDAVAQTLAQLSHPLRANNNAAAANIAGCHFVLTGSFPTYGAQLGENAWTLGKGNLTTLIENVANGGIVQDSVNGRTNFVVIGHRPGKTKVSRTIEALGKPIYLEDLEAAIAGGVPLALVPNRPLAHAEFGWGFGRRQYPTTFYQDLKMCGQRL